VSNANQPAFPALYGQTNGADGLTKREYVASAIMAAMAGYSDSEGCLTPSNQADDFTEDEKGDWYHNKPEHGGRWWQYRNHAGLSPDTLGNTDGKRYRYLNRPYEVRIARDAVSYADALLAELAKEPTK
jgi:type II secretory pathway pseudopilin PulG